MSVTDNTIADDVIWQVSELNYAARASLERQFGLITVCGELSGFTPARSGHWYFTLKDSESQIRCAMFRNRNVYVQQRPKDGDLIHLQAKVSIYPDRGEYQLIGESLTPAGDGLLQIAFQKLKSTLAQEGLFDPDRKRPIPEHCRRVAVISSANGAAIHDFISVAKARMPGLAIDLLPVPVQGEQAAPAAVDAINLCHALGIHDVIVVTRGGGSYEDLWSFNDEGLARAIAASDIPIISAIGHETDFTIADFVADLRAPTPSAAAQAVTTDQSHLQQTLHNHQQRLWQGINSQLEKQRWRTRALHAHLQSPQQKLHDINQRLDKLTVALETTHKQQLNQWQREVSQWGTNVTRLSPLSKLQLHRQQLANLAKSSRQLTHLQLHNQQEKLRRHVGSLQQLSPLQTLARGFSITEDTQGNIITQAKQVKPDQPLRIRLHEGEISVVNKGNRCND